MADESTGSDSDAGRGEARARRPAVLVVDDVRLNCSHARRLLEPEGYEVIVAESGQEALDAFTHAQPDVVLLDAMMPVMDGFETCACLRRLPGGADTPIVFFTALDDLESHNKAMAAGADDFLLKPIRRAELLIRVGALLRLKRLTGELQNQFEISRRQNHELRRVQGQKDDLTALVVHDLKTPLAVLNLDAEYILGIDNLPPVARETIDSMRDSIDTMRRMVVDMLDIARAENGVLSVRRQPLDVPSTVDRVASSLRRRLDEKGHRLTTHVQPSTVYADPDLIRRVLENLLDNACKYTEVGGTISIRAATLGSRLRVDVTDQGPGVPEHALQSIFEKYVQLGERRHRHSRGLGLAFCKLAIEAHGGRVWAENAETGGARFSLELGIAQPS